MKRDKIIDGAIIAGGMGSRLSGADKGLLEWGKLRFAEHIANKLRPYIDQLIINCNRNAHRYGIIADLIIQDELENYQGPLAGLQAILTTTDADYVLIAPCDTPLLTQSYPIRMLQALNDTVTPQENTIFVAHDGNRLQPMHLLLPTGLKHSLEQFLGSGDRKMMMWLHQQNVVEVDFQDRQNEFLNINSPQEFDTLRQTIPAESDQTG
ncbi:MAG: molybdenum cofactor guanylyltransferase [Pseudomonadales bacterium]|nr:molybdenum cofactor guanylyltransferase [Pseudomonadales bacterium]